MEKKERRREWKNIPMAAFFSGSAPGWGQELCAAYKKQSLTT